MPEDQEPETPLLLEEGHLDTSEVADADNVRLSMNEMDQKWDGATRAQGLPIALPRTNPGLIQPPYPPPQAVMHIPDLPDAARWWATQKPTMLLWMVLSIIVVALSLFTFNIISFVAAVLGIVGASLHVCTCCGGADLSGPVKAISILGFCTLGFCAVSLTVHSLFLIIGLSCNPHEHVCNIPSVWWVLFYEAWIVGLLVVSGVAASRALHMKRMLNPVTAGMVVLA